MRAVEIFERESGELLGHLEIKNPLFFLEKLGVGAHYKIPVRTKDEGLLALDLRVERHRTPGKSRLVFTCYASDRKYLKGLRSFFPVRDSFVVISPETEYGTLAHAAASLDFETLESRAISKELMEKWHQKLMEMEPAGPEPWNTKGFDIAHKYGAKFPEKQRTLEELNGPLKFDEDRMPWDGESV